MPVELGSGLPAVSATDMRMFDIGLTKFIKCGEDAALFEPPLPPAFAPDARPAKLAGQFAAHEGEDRAFTLMTEDGTAHSFHISPADAARLADGFDPGHWTDYRLIHTPKSLAMLFEAAGDNQGALEAVARAASLCGSGFDPNT